MAGPRNIICMVALIGATACGSLGESGEKMFAARQKQSDMAQPRIAEHIPPPALIRDDHVLLGILEVNSHGDRLPAKCEQPITLRSARPLSLNEIAARLSDLLQVPVQLELRSSRDPAEAAQTVHRPGAAGAPPGFPVGENPPAVVPDRPFALGASHPRGALFQPDLSGNCVELFDRIAGQFNVEWRMRGGILSFDDLLVRTFQIKASAATSQFTSNMSSGGNSASQQASSPTGNGSAAGGAGAGGSSQSASVSMNSDIWAEIESGLKTLVTSGGKYSISRAAGTVTIVASPKQMSDVATYIDSMNKLLAATIAIEVSAIYITVDDLDNYGLDLNALYQVGAQKYSLNGLLPSLSQSPGTGSIAILSPPAGANNFATHFAGSQLFLNAVSSSNRLADYRSATVTGRNGVAMPIALATNQDIVRSLQFAVGLQSGAASTSASTSTINYGFSLQVLPRLVAPDIVSVFISFTANDLTNLQDFPVGNAGSLELATIDSRSFWNESPLRVGQTLVIAGTEQEKVIPQRSGIGSVNNWLLGGQIKNEVIRTRLILLVTPSIMALPS
jgi:type IVB pilus formation R64 PilN family outer membrane protein